MPAFLAATPGVKLLGVDISKQLTSSLKGLPLVGGLLAKNKDPERLAANAKLFAEAMAGSAAALDLLWLRSGRKDPTQGVASQPAKDDAWQKYQTAKASPAQPALPDAFQVPNLPTLNFDEVLPKPLKDGVDQAAKALGTTSNTVMWIALAIGVVAVVKSLRK